LDTDSRTWDALVVAAEAAVSGAKQEVLALAA
jgi:hypothetical protein